MVERSSLEITPTRAVERLEESLGLSSAELAAVLGASVRTVERWRSRESHPQKEARGRMAELVQLEEHVGETFGDPESGRAWLREPSPFLGGLTPAEALRAGRSDRVEAALEALDSGVFI